jgi:hypothetical protein
LIPVLAVLLVLLFAQPRDLLGSGKVRLPDAPEDAPRIQREETPWDP